MSVYKRGGTYHYDFWFRGKRYRKATGLTNKTTAVRAEAIRKAELAQGRLGLSEPKECPIFQKFAEEEFLPWSKQQHALHPRTHKRYQVSIKALLKVFGNFGLGDIGAANIEKFKCRRSKEISNAGTNRDLAALRCILNFAVREGYLFRNPMQDVKLLPEGPGNMRIVSHTEQQRYMTVAHPTLRDVATLIVETGMRPEEVFTIRKENVHLADRYLFVPTGKTRNARRNVPLTPTCVEILKRRLGKARGAYLFPKRWEEDNALTTVRNHHLAAVKSFSPKFRLYDFRHTFGSRSAMAGVDLATLKELMGHSNIATTMRYVHPTPQHKRDAVLKLQQYNAEMLIAAYERCESPQNSPQ